MLKIILILFFVVIGCSCEDYDDIFLDATTTEGFVRNTNLTSRDATTTEGFVWDSNWISSTPAATTDQEECGKGHHAGKKCVIWYLCRNVGVLTGSGFETDERMNYDQPNEKLCPVMQICCEPDLRELAKTNTNLLNMECAQTTNFVGFIRGGSKVLPRKFPFLAALVLASNSEFFCGGSLITEKHVLTAAHCVQEKGSRENLRPDDVLVLLGRHNLALRAERKSETREVEDIIVHEDWNFHTTKYDADLAILVMDRSVTFSLSVRPICITSNLSALSLSNGTVAGWSQADSGVGHEELPKMAKVYAVSSDKCLELQGDLGPKYSSRMFCAKGDKASPCLGDAGGSFFVNYKGRLIATGIVSSGLSGCNVDDYMLYTKISDFVAWIKETVLDNP